MQSLSIKVSTDLNTGMRKEWLRGRGSSGLTELEASTRRRWLNCRYFARNCRIVACASQRNSDGGGGAGQSSSSSSSPSSFLSQSQTYALLKQQMEVAAKSEDYKEAARIRDSLRLFEEEEPALRLRRLMKEAVADERFEVFRFFVSLSD
ncbi:hypothetical protein F2P56_019825 [Juglans regia]|uniref:UVR domain-containing protein n=1 Tax=Juglans regia TaxID=51240 RepID=A0A833THI3_JUGRE|nr:hypothetical protein F2P56_019825 [Juglans regia]